MEEAKISQKTAALALEAGFDYRPIIDRWFGIQYAPCPQSVLQRWLREKHNFHVSIHRKEAGSFSWSAEHLSKMHVYFGFLDEYPTYEKCLEAFLIFALNSIDPKVKFLFP